MCVCKDRGIEVKLVFEKTAECKKKKNRTAKQSPVFNEILIGIVAAV